MSKNAIKTLLLTMLTLCMCTTLVVGGTFALFTGKVEVNNHLQAGNLQIGLVRTSFTEVYLKDDGLQDVRTNDTDLDLTSNSEELFNIEKTAPGCEYEAVLDITNKGSVAFEYGMRIIWDEQSQGVATTNVLAKQLKVTVKNSDSSVNKVFWLSDYAAQGDIRLGHLLASADAQKPHTTFTVSVEFVCDTIDSSIDNDDAQNLSVAFDVQVYATQITSAN